MLVIDCYNVLFTPMPPVLAGLDEAGLCRTLARTSWARGARGDRGPGSIVVVADGQPKPLGLAASPVDTVDLIYSGHGRKADDVIIEMVNDHVAPRRVTVVSTDREIRAAARHRRCTSWTSEQFITRLVEQLRAGHRAGTVPPGKPTGKLTDEETNAWLKTFGIPPPEAPPEAFPRATDVSRSPPPPEVSPARPAQKVPPPEVSPALPETARSAKKSSGHKEGHSQATEPPSGDAKQSSEGAKRSSGDAEETSGGVKQPSRDASQSSGGAGEASGDVKQPSRDASQSSGGAGEASGGVKQPSRDASQSSGGAGETSGGDPFDIPGLWPPKMD